MIGRVELSNHYEYIIRMMHKCLNLLEWIKIGDKIKITDSTFVSLQICF